MNVATLLLMKLSNSAYCSLSTLRCLQKLYISGNRLSDLAPLCVLTTLEELHAGGQRGSGPLALPPELINLPRLRVLLVPQNGLADVVVLGHHRGEGLIDAGLMPAKSRKAGAANH